MSFTGPQPALGRLYSPDARDRRYLMAAPRSTRTFRNWLVPPFDHVNDQGDTSECVAHSIDAYLRAHPVVNGLRAQHAIDKTAFYEECQRIDEFEGEDYEGTTVRAGFDLLRKRGMVLAYGWAWDAGTVAAHVIAIGPVVVGSLWTLEMFMPDAKGYIAPQGPVIGGHAYLVVGVNLRRNNPDGTTGAFRILNSWGMGWGQKGRAWVTFNDMDYLIKEYGEACTALEIKVAA